MFGYPKTIKEAREYRYGAWTANPLGSKYIENQCAAEVAYGGRSPLFHQCSNLNGKGVNGLYCRIHAKKLDKLSKLHA